MTQPMTHRLTYQRRTPRDPKPLADLAAGAAEVEQAARELASILDSERSSVVREREEGTN